MRVLNALGILMFVLIGSILAAGLASAAEVPVELDKIWVDGSEFEAGDDMLLDLEKGQDIDIRVKLTANSSDEEVQVEATLRGYEYDDHEKTSDITHVFDIEPNATYYKDLSLQLPENMDSDDYRLTITITNRNDDELKYNFYLRVSSERHSLVIKDIDFTPATGVEAGKSFLAQVRIKNIGDRDEESVKVRVTVPALGISASDYIDEIEADDTESSEEIWLRVPDCADEGVYMVVVDVTYDEMYEKITAVAPLAVTADVCKADASAVPAEDDDEEEEEVDFGSLDFGPENDEDDRAEVLRSALEVGLVVLIIALVILGLVIGFMSLAKEKEF